MLTRIYLAPADLDETVAFYEKIFGVKCDQRFEYAEAGLELAGIGPILLIAGSDEKLHNIKLTQATFIVDSIDDSGTGCWGLGQ